mgnify:CR=1 FL=1
MMRNTFSSQEWLKFIGKEKLQTFQDSFARVDNISLCFFDLEGTPLTVWSNSSLLCHQIIQNNKKRCQQEKEKWGKMIEKYLRQSANLKQVFLLVDIRHDPSENDKMMYNWIVDNGFRPVIIATKLDKLKRSQIAKHVKAVRAGLGLKEDDILIPFSSQTKQGLDELWNTIEGYIGQ